MGDFNTDLFAPHLPRSRMLMEIVESASLLVLPLLYSHHGTPWGWDTWLDIILSSNPYLVSFHGKY